MSLTCGIDVQKGVSDLGHLVGGLPVAPNALAPFQGGGFILQKGPTFVQKWQEILSAFEGSEKSAASDGQAIESANEESASTPTDAAAFMPRSVEVSQLHRALSSGINRNGLCLPNSIRLGEHIPIAVNANCNSGASSNRCDDAGGKGKILAKDTHPPSSEGMGVKSTELQQTDSFKATVPAAVSEVIIPAAHLLTVASPISQMPEHRLPQECSHPDVLPNCYTASANDASLFSVSNDAKNLHEQIEVDSVIPAVTSADSSLRSSSQLLTYSAHDGVPASTSAVSSSVEMGLHARSHLPIEVGIELHDRSIPKNPIGNSMSGSSTAHPETESLTMENGSPVQAVKTGTTQRATISARDILSVSRATAGAPLSASHFNNAVPTFIGAREEPSAPSYASANVSRSALSTSSESIERAKTVSETFEAIDAQDQIPASQWTLSGSRRAEAGFQDPSLGWVSVRAQAGTGGIHATLVPASDVAGEALNTHLAGLNAHVTPRYEHLNPITLASPDVAMNGQDAAEHSPQRDGRGSHQSEAQQSQNSQTPRTDTVQSISSPIMPVEMGSVESTAITAGQSPGEQHVSVIV